MIVAHPQTMVVDIDCRAGGIAVKLHNINILEPFSVKQVEKELF